MGKEIQTVNYNIDTRRQASVTGATQRNQPLVKVTRRQQNQILAINLVRNGGAPVDDLITNTDVFSWVAELKDDFDQTTVVQMKTTNSGINQIGDRPDLDILNGKLSVQLDADTAELLTSLGAAAGALSGFTLNMELQIRDFGNPLPKAVFRWDTDSGDGLTVLNIIDDAGAGPGPTPIVLFYTIVEIDALLAGKEELQTFQTGVIDFVAGATTAVVTIPGPNAFIPLRVFDRTDTITGGGVAHEFQIETDAPRDLMSVPQQSLSNLVNKMTRVDISDDIIVLPGEIIRVKFPTVSTFATHTGRVVLNGLLVGA